MASMTSLIGTIVVLNKNHHHHQQGMGLHRRNILIGHHKPCASHLTWGGRQLKTRQSPQATNNEPPSHANIHSKVGIEAGHETRNLQDYIQPILNFVINNFLSVVLVCGVLLGLSYPELGRSGHRLGITKWSTFGIFLLSGLTLQTKNLAEALEAWPVLLFGLVSVLLFTPLFATFTSQVQLAPRELITGLRIFCCVPTTLSSGVALTQMAGGNATLALTLTVVSNLLGIVTVPFMISKLIASGQGVSIAAGPLVMGLIWTLLIPLLIGKVLRDTVQGLALWVDKRRKLCTILSSLCLSLTPWIQVSQSRAFLLQITPFNLLAAIFLGLLLHALFLMWNLMGVSTIQFFFGSGEDEYQKRSSALAIILTGSQKTLPVMIAVVEKLGGSLGETGLLVLPCIAAHINQILFDSLLVNSWVKGRHLIK